MRHDAETQKIIGGTLLCFAVKEEAATVRGMLGQRANVSFLITGMGRLNAERTFRARLKSHQPSRVITCGFAGGLNPQLHSGTVIFSGADAQQEMDLLAAGAVAAKFRCAERVAVTVAEKRALREATGADAVEMESQVIAEICREQHIPCATVRVVLDTAIEDLPLDFNALMTADQRMNYWKLAGTLLKSPGKIGELKRFRKRCESAAAALAQALVKIIPA